MSSSTSSSTYTINRGDFEALGLDSQSVFMLSRAFKFLEETPGSWDILAQPDIPGENGFMFTQDARLNEISRKIGDDDQCGHSGASYGWTMRNMEAIAKKGWDNYCLGFSKRRKQPDPQSLKDKEIAELKARIATLEAENNVLLQREMARPSVMEQAAAVDSFINRTPASVAESPLAFAEAIQKDPEMRRMIPDIDEQADAMKRFAQGKLSYAEMRSLCG